MQKWPSLAGKWKKNTTTTKLVRDRRSRKLTEKAKRLIVTITHDKTLNGSN